MGRGRRSSVLLVSGSAKGSDVIMQISINFFFGYVSMDEYTRGRGGDQVDIYPGRATRGGMNDGLVAMRVKEKNIYPEFYNVYSIP